MVRGPVYTQLIKAAHPEVVVIGCCGGNDSRDLARRERGFFNAGADAFVGKDAGTKALCEEIDNWLPQEEEAGEPFRASRFFATLAVELVVLGVALWWLVNFGLPVPLFLIVLAGAPLGLITSGGLLWLMGRRSLSYDIGAALLGFTGVATLVFFLMSFLLVNG